MLEIVEKSFGVNNPPTTTDFLSKTSADFLTDFHQRLLSSMFDKIGGYQRFL